MKRVKITLCTRAAELATESIPGCVLQLYVWLNNPEEAGSFALGSIVISALTTGYASAMIAYDFDVDVPHRKVQSNFYGYIPDDNGLRSRCFVLMTLISTLHNLSKSLGCALLASSSGKMTAVYFIGVEFIAYFAFKIARKDYYWFARLDGILAIIGSFVQRIGVKIVVDFSGCWHFRHPYVASCSNNRRFSL